VRKESLRWIRTGLGLILSLVFLWLALGRLDFRRIVAAAAHIRWVSLPLAMLALGIGYTARVIRWWLMLRVFDGGISPRSCGWPLLVGVAVNNVVPLRVGDAVRVLSFRQELRAPAARLLGTLLVERLLDVTVLLGMFSVCVMMIPKSGSSTLHSHIGVVVGMAAVVGWALFAVAGKRLEEWLLRQCRAAKREWIRAGERHVKQVVLATSVIRTPFRALQLLGMSLIVWVCEGAAFESIAQGMGYDGHALGPWFACASGTLSTLIPSSPGYIGTFDYFAMSALVTYGASRPFAVAFSLVVHAVLWVPLTATGIAYVLTSESKAVRKLFAASLTDGPESM